MTNLKRLTLTIIYFGLVAVVVANALGAAL